MSKNESGNGQSEEGKGASSGKDIETSRLVHRLTFSGNKNDKHSGLFGKEASFSKNGGSSRNTGRNAFAPLSDEYSRFQICRDMRNLSIGEESSTSKTFLEPSSSQNTMFGTKITPRTPEKEAWADRKHNESEVTKKPHKRYMQEPVGLDGPAKMNQEQRIRRSSGGK